MSLPAAFHNFAAYLMQGTLVVLIGALLAKVFRIRVPKVLLFYWQLLLVFCLSFPLLAPRQPISTAPFNAASIQQASTVETVVLSQAQPAAPTGNPGAAAWRVLLLILACGCAVRLGWLVAGSLRLRQLRRRAHRLALSPEIENTVSVAARTAEILISPDIPGPATFGCLHPTILLPVQFEQMDAGAQMSILCHELIHVRRRDWMFALVEQMVLAVFWFHPAVWWLIRRIELAREQLVDREVVELPIDRRQYLKSLVFTVGERGAFLSANLFLTSHHLKERVALLLEEIHMSRMRLIISLASVGVLVCVGAAIATYAFPLSGYAVSPAQNPGIQAGPVSAPAPPASPVPVLAQAAARQGLTGMVVDQHGAVVPGVEVKVTDQETKSVIATGVTDEKGRFAFVIPSPARIQLTFSREGFRQSTIQNVVIGDAPVTVRSVLQISGAAPPASPLPALAQAAAGQSSLNGIAVDPDGALVPGVEVKVTDMETQSVIATGVTDERGCFVFKIPSPARIQLTFSREGFKQSIIRDVRMIAYTPVTVRATLQIGGGNELVEVKAGDATATAEQSRRISTGATTPRPFQKVAPVYPPAARQQGIEGIVILAVTVDTNGELADIQVLKGHPLLNDAAIEAVRQWRYIPAVLNGRPYPCTLTITLKFTM
jgi:TonB family protein